MSLLVSAVGSLTNPHKVEKTFLIVKQTKISPYKIKSYIDYFKDAFLVSVATRYGYDEVGDMSIKILTNKKWDDIKANYDVPHQKMAEGRPAALK